jgi:hypothetical protein
VTGIVSIIVSTAVITVLCDILGIWALEREARRGIMGQPGNGCLPRGGA